MHGPDSRPPDKTGGGFALEPRSTGTHFSRGHMRTAVATLLGLLGLMVAIEAAHLKYHQETSDQRNGLGAGLDPPTSDCPLEPDREQER